MFGIDVIRIGLRIGIEVRSGIRLGRIGRRHSAISAVPRKRQSVG